MEILNGQTWMAGPRPAMTMERPRYPAATRFERCVARAVLLWVPACAGMTVFCGNDGFFEGTTDSFAGMTDLFAVMTDLFAGMTDLLAVMTNFFKGVRH
jgi:hypothetical protein